MSDEYEKMRKRSEEKAEYVRNKERAKERNSQPFDSATGPE